MEGKKAYQTPKLVVLGDLEQVTQQGGGNQVDVPIGTAVVGDVSSVIGS
ncbi:MAG: lasso RiPP family leader peptide-containing protein [Planctomycetota bacterium]